MRDRVSAMPGTRSSKPAARGCPKRRLGAREQQELRTIRGRLDERVNSVVTAWSQTGHNRTASDVTRRTGQKAKGLLNGLRSTRRHGATRPFRGFDAPSSRQPAWRALRCAVTQRPQRPTPRRGRGPRPRRDRPLVEPGRHSAVDVEAWTTIMASRSERPVRSNLARGGILDDHRQVVEEWDEGDSGSSARTRDATALRRCRSAARVDHDGDESTGRVRGSSA
jgi:hypothetical protein